MAKKKKASLKAVKPRKEEGKTNLFESIYNKKKFDILGQKSKATPKKRGQARKEGIEKRKGTLLVEYKQRQKANSFQDRRFGENDEGLSAEDKALARFQKQKLKEIEGRKFQLDDASGGEEDELTHLGAPIRDNLAKYNGFGSDGDDDYQIDPEAEAALHFGGGFQKKVNGPDDAGEEPRRRSKKEVMEEIMAKSKAYKAEKAKQKEEDFDAADKLDEELAEIMQSGGLSAFIKPKGRKEKDKGSVAEEDAAYDARREMVFDSKAKVSERTKTAEEVAQEEVQRLEALEKERQRRMTGEEEAEPASVDLQGGYAKKRAKRKREENETTKEATGDALEDDFEPGSNSEDESDEDGSEDEPSRNKSRQKMSLDERRQMRAAGDHPLQESFRGAASQLMTKYGLLESDSEDENEEEDEEISHDGEDESADQLSEDDAENNIENKKGLKQHQKTANGKDQLNDAHSGDSDSEESSDADDPEEEGELAEKNMTVEKESKSTAGISTEDTAADLPFTIEAPSSYQDFAKIVHGRSDVDLNTVIHRIRISTNIALAEANKKKMQIFYGTLVQHFALLANESPLSMSHLDVLTVQILELTPMVPLYAASTAIARLTRLHERLHSRLSDGESAWPNQGQLLLLKLWATVFPASDKRHSVLTPAMLLIGSHLALCPLTDCLDIKAGLFLAALGTQMAASASRWMPEPLSFLMKVFTQIINDTQSSQKPSSAPVFSFRNSQSDQIGKESRRHSLNSSNIPLEEPPKLKFDFQGSQNSREDLSESCSIAAVELLDRIASQNEGLLSLPEALSSALNSLERLQKQATLPKAVLTVISRVFESVRSRVTALLSTRKPLKKVKLQKEIKQYNPRYEEDFVSGKDYDPDSERAERRKLKKMLISERRGAIRELRKDASYLGDQREAERRGDDKERKRDVRGNTAWLAKLEQDFRSGGQGGLWKKKRNK